MRRDSMLFYWATRSKNLHRDQLPGGCRFWIILASSIDHFLFFSWWSGFWFNSSISWGSYPQNWKSRYQFYRRRVRMIRCSYGLKQLSATKLLRLCISTALSFYHPSMKRSNFGWDGSRPSWLLFHGRRVRVWPREIHMARKKGDASARGPG